MTAKEQERADELLLRLVVNLNLAFSIVESKDFEEFVHALRPSYKIPGRRKVAGTLLDAEYKHVKVRKICLV